MRRYGWDTYISGYIILGGKKINQGEERLIEKRRNLQVRTDRKNKEKKSRLILQGEKGESKVRTDRKGKKRINFYNDLEKRGDPNVGTDRKRK